MRDYAKLVNSNQISNKAKPKLQNSPTQKTKKSNWLLKGIIFLALLYLVFSIWQHYQGHKIGKISNKKNHASQELNGHKAAAPQTIFDFYTVLPKGATPKAKEVSTAPANTAPAPTTPPASTNPNQTAAATPPAATNATSTSAVPASGTSSPAATTTASATTESTTNTPTTTAASATAPTYTLVVASYTDQNSAQSMRSQLLLLGINNVNVNTVDGEYLVTVGPYSDVDAMNIIKTQLQANGIKAQVISSP